MKDIARQSMSIKVESMDLLNGQIKMEAHASATYLAMASWCEQNGFFTSAKFFFKFLTFWWIPVVIQSLQRLRASITITPPLWTFLSLRWSMRLR